MPYKYIVTVVNTIKFSPEHKYSIIKEIYRKT